MLCSGVQEYMYSLFIAEGECMYVYVCPGRLAFVKMYNNFLQVVVLLKMQFCGYPLFKWDLLEKKC